MMTTPVDEFGRLLAFQQMLAMLPTQGALCAFTRRALATVPGTAFVRLCVGGSLYPPDDRFDPIRALCQRAAEAPALLDVAACTAQTRAHCFPVWSGTHLFGLLIMEAADDHELRLHSAFIAGMANALAVVLETRKFQATLAEMVELRQVARDELVLRIAERAREVGQMNRRLQRLSEKLLTAQENERRDVARELHDEIGQVLTAVRMNLELTTRHVKDADVLERLGHGKELVDHALQQIHDLALNLRPAQLDDIGLVAALRWHIDRQAQALGLQISFAADELPARIPSEVTIACFRIAQEALTNIIRHAHARHARIELRVANHALVLTIADDGQGFPEQATKPDGLGMLGMRERASLVGGVFRIDSIAGSGTRIEATLPYRKSSTGRQALKVAAL